MSPAAARAGKWVAPALAGAAAIVTVMLVLSLTGGIPRQRRAARLAEEAARLAAPPPAATAPAESTPDPRVARITARNLMGPPKAPMGQLTGVLGDAAIFNGAQLVKVGDSFMNAKVLAIGPNWADVEFEGKVQKLYVFTPTGGGAPPAAALGAGPPSPPGGPPGAGQVPPRRGRPSPSAPPASPPGPKPAAPAAGVRVRPIRLNASAGNDP